MTVKTNGREFKRFYNDDTVWPQGYWHDDETVGINGVGVDSSAIDLGVELNDSDEVTLDGGDVLDKHDRILCTLEEYFLQWRRKQATTPLFVEVPAEKRAAVIAAIEAAGGTAI